MIQRFTVYVTYFLQNTTGNGYGDAVHCNYIKKFGFDDIANQEVNIYFSNPDDFKFISPSRDSGTGFVADKICMLVQIVSNESLFQNAKEINDTEEKPQSHLWKKFDVTNQILGHTIGEPLTPTDLTSGVFKVALNDYNLTGNTLYDLEYLNYPQNSESNSLSFGHEEIFFGNVDTEIEASVYTTDLVINLPIDEFNTTTNPTWNGESQDNSVYITEIGILNDDKELIGIGKLNNPLQKNNEISRTIVFEIDF